jgi:protein-tyrosine kinase
MGLIEQAARRLEELRRAGVDNTPTPVEPVRTPPPVEPVRPHAVKPRVAAAPPPAAHSRSARVDFDLAALAALGFVTPDMPRSRIADEFRVIKRPLLANIAAGAGIANANLVMVTSALPGEGKSFCAVNLAMSIAMELDRTVLLVDSDVARPSLPRMLGLPDTPGMLDLLGDDSVGVGQVLLRTNVEKLTFLSSGRRHARATEMLASAAMANLLDELAARYPDRVVVFDSPPLLVTTEARVLASRMGQIVFIVDAETTPQSEVKRALATVDACPIKLMVLNKARTTAQGAYGYGYGYGS